MMPQAGGGYVYIREAFGPLAAFLCGWMTLLLISTGALAAVAMGFSGYVERYMDLEPIGGRLGMAALTIVILGATNYIGVKPGAALQNLLTVAKIVALGALIVVGFAMWNSVGAPMPVANERQSDSTSPTPRPLAQVSYAATHSSESAAKIVPALISIPRSLRLVAG